MAERDKDVTDLEDLFQAARRQGIALPDGLEDRIIADGLQVQRARQGRSASPRRASAGRVRQFLDLLGGWPAMGGLAMGVVRGPLSVATVLLKYFPKLLKNFTLSLNGGSLPARLRA